MPSEHLDKARGAMDAARRVHDQIEQRRARREDVVELEVQWVDLLGIAKTQAEIAQAEALERIADLLDARLPIRELVP